MTTQWHEVPGWFDWTWIYDEAIARSPKGAKFVEIGCWFGRSSAYFGQKAIELGREDVTLYAVDTWEATACNPAEVKLVKEQFGGSIFEAFKHNMRVCGLMSSEPTWTPAKALGLMKEAHDVVIPVRMPSLDAVSQFEDGSLDLVFVDGDHTYEGCLADIKAWLPKVRPGGAIAGHDLDWPGVAKAVEEVFGGKAEFCQPKSWRVWVKPEERTQKVVLAMISNQPREIVERAVKSCRAIADEWLVLVDPGDPLVGAELDVGYMGEVVAAPWVDHGTNRTQAIRIAEKMGADYVLMIDATASLEFDDGWKRPFLISSAYELLIVDVCTMSRPQLFRTGDGWHYVGAAHEYAQATVPGGLARLDSVRYVRRGGAHGKEKFMRDAEAFKKQLELDPSNTRAQHYLAQSYEDAKMFPEALVEYAKRAEMEHGWREETFIAKLRFANLCDKLNHEFEIVVAAYLEAYEQQPDRAEPLAYAARYCRRKEKPWVASIFDQAAAKIPLPGPRALLVDPGAYAHVEAKAAE